MSFLHFTEYDDPYLQELLSPHSLLHLLCISLAQNLSYKLCPPSFNFDSSFKNQASYSYSFWSVTDACMSFLCFIKYNNSYFHEGLYPPHLLLHFYIHFIIYTYTLPIHSAITRLGYVTDLVIWSKFC